MRDLFKKIRFSLRFFLAFCQKHYQLIFLGFLAGVLAFFYLPKAAQLLSRKKAQIIGIVGHHTLDQLPLDIQLLIGEGLTAITGDDRPQPLIAKEWTIKDDKEYLFTLKENIFWQDGKPVLAKDIDYNFSDVTTTVINNQQIRFELKEPFVPFPSVVARPIFKKGLIGTGKYKVTKIKKNGQLVEKLTLQSKEKDKTKMTFRFYPTQQAIKTAFKLGEINTIWQISQPEELEKWPRIKITPVVKNNYFVALFFNTQDQKMENKSTRQALAYTLNKPWKPRALTPVNPNSWAYNGNVKPYNFDLNKAKSLLEEKPETIELATIPSLLEAAESIKADWEKLGIETKIKVINNLDEPFQALLATQEIAPDPDQYILWHSTQETNISRYKSPKIDKLLEDGRKTFSEDRKQIYADFQKFLVEDTPAVFLYHPSLYTISRI